MARALAGDHAGAIDDFKIFLDWTSREGMDPMAIPNDWKDKLESMQAVSNPFFKDEEEIDTRDLIFSVWAHNEGLKPESPSRDRRIWIENLEQGVSPFADEALLNNLSIRTPPGFFLSGARSTVSVLEKEQRKVPGQPNITDISKTYVYQDDVFSVDIPLNWKAQDLSQGTVQAVRFDSRSNLIQMLIYVRKLESDDSYRLGLLEGAVKRFFEKEREFAMGKPFNLSDGRNLGISWQFERIVDGESTKFRGGAFTWQRDERFAVRMVSSPVELFDRYSDKFFKMINSFKMPPVKKFFYRSHVYEGRDGRRFWLEIPEAWVTETTRSPMGEVITFGDESGAQLAVHLLPFSGVGLDLKRALGQRIEDLYLDKSNFEMIKEPHISKRSGGIFAVFLYDDDIEKRIRAVASLRLSKDSLAMLIISIPDELFGAYEDMILTAFNSFKLDPPVAALPSEP